MEFEDLASINSELRYITIELMKLAAQRGIPFEEALGEFLKNTSTLRNSIRSGSVPRHKLARVRVADAAAPATPRLKPVRK